MSPRDQLLGQLQHLTHDGYALAGVWLMVVVAAIVLPALLHRLSRGGRR